MNIPTILESELRRVITPRVAVDTIREAFRADGEGRWSLTVQRKSLDALVDQVPWALTPVLRPWMAEPVDVRW